MTKDEAMTTIGVALEKTLARSVEICEDTDLIESGILDSLDGMVFLLEIETAAGCSFPEGTDLVKEGYYRVSKLVSLLSAGA